MAAHTYVNAKTGASFRCETTCGGGPWVERTPAPVAAPEKSVPVKQQRKKEA